MLIYPKESYAITGCLMTVHRELGCGFLEAVYQEALEREFREAGIPFKREESLKILYKGVPLSKEYIADFVCYDKIIVELKAVPELDDANRAPLYNYLKVSNYHLGLLVNFGDDQELVIERLVNRHYKS